MLLHKTARHSFEPIPSADLPAEKPKVRLAHDGEIPVASPALALQQRLEAGLAAPETGRLPLIYSLLVWLTLAGLFWWGIISAALGLLRVV